MPFYKSLATALCLLALIAPAWAAPAQAAPAQALPIAFALPQPDATEPMPYAGGGAEDALYICCAAGLCTYSAIDDCSLLSSTGKIVALSVTGVGGLTGLAIGFLGGSLLLALDENGSVTPYDGSSRREADDSILALGFLGGAVGFLVGSTIGLVMGLVVSPFCADPPKVRPSRRSLRRQPPSKSPSAPSTSPPPRMGASVFLLAE